MPLYQKIQTDPVWFIQQTFGEEVIGKQNEVLKALADPNVRAVYVPSCHDSGKTHTAARALMWWLLAYPDNSKVISTAPSWPQVENLLWREVREGYAKAKHAMGGTMLTTRWDLGPQWFAIGLSTDQPVNLQGYHSENILVIVDEADGIDPLIWGAIDGLLTTSNAKLLAIGNPLDPTSEFKKRHDFAGMGERVIRIAADDVLPHSANHPFLLQRPWVEDKRRRWGEQSALWFGKVLARWPDQGADTLIPISWLTLAKSRLVPRGLRTLGVDVARFGNDRTVRTLMDGGWLVSSEANMQEDLTVTAGRVIADIKNHGPVQVAIDATGIGSGVVDIVRAAKLSPPIIEFNAAAKAYNEDQFDNLAAEWYWNTREAFRLGQIGFNMEHPDAVDELISDLNRPKFDYTGRMSRLVVDKFGLGPGKSSKILSMEERASRSPDRGDSFVLGFNAARPFLTTLINPWQTTQTYHPQRKGMINA